jgi:hypothetical protein
MNDMPFQSNITHCHQRACLALIWAIVTICLSSTVVCQVTIRERIPISPGEAKSNQTKSLENAAYIIAPLDGIYSITPREVQELWGPIPDSAFFRVSRNDTSYTGHVNDYMSRDVSMTTGLLYNVCTQEATRKFVWIKANLPNFDNEFFVTGVVAGDTLFIEYSSSAVAQDQWASTDVQDTSWNVVCFTMDECFPNLYEFKAELDVAFVRPELYAFTVKTKADTLSPGDTTVLRVQAINEDSMQIPLTGSTLLKLTIDSTTYAQFMDKNGQLVQSPFEHIRYDDLRDGKISVVAKDTEPDSSVVVTINVEKEDETSKRGRGSFIVRTQSFEIMLGETKFYRVENRNQRLVIVEDTLPRAGTGVPNVWGQNPFTTVTGGKMGVYWERTNSNGQPLDSRLIRIIGRYWEEANPYKVRLTTSGGPSAIIKVARPGHLGTKNLTAKDVYGDSYNLDSVIVYHAGKNGILPQYVKGIIQEESVGKFSPAYRYEPYTDMAKVHGGDSVLFKKSPYWIKSSDSTGKPPIPSDHTNLNDANGNHTSYPGFTTVWDYYFSHRGFYGFGIYGNTNNLRTKRKGLRSEVVKGLGLDSTSIPAGSVKLIEDSTDTAFYSYLRNEYGMGSTVAQTRIAASYGIMQLMYTESRSDGYPQDATRRPEDISDHRIGLRYGMQHFLNELIFILEGEMQQLDSNEWSNGIEYVYWKTLGEYNHRDDYPGKIITNSQNYLPRKVAP